MRPVRPGALFHLAPTTTGSATAIALIYPELKGKLNGHAVRVPALNASLTDCVFELQRPTTADEFNELFKAASQLGPQHHGRGDLQPDGGRAVVGGGLNGPRSVRAPLPLQSSCP